MSNIDIKINIGPARSEEGTLHFQKLAEEDNQGIQRGLSYLMARLPIPIVKATKSFKLSREWQDYRALRISILKTLQEHDQAWVEFNTLRRVKLTALLWIWLDGVEPNSGENWYLADMKHLKLNEHLTTNTEKQTMALTNETNSTVAIESRIFIYGRPESEVSDDEMFEIINRKQNEVDQMSGRKVIPKKLEAKIKRAKEDIAKLIEFVDSRPE